MDTKFQFNYAIRNAAGQFFTGPAFCSDKRAVYGKEQFGPPHLAYTYEENRAHVICLQNPEVFADCEVVQFF